MHPPHASATALYLLKLSLSLHGKLPAEALREGQPAGALRLAALGCGLRSLSISRGPDHPLCVAMELWQSRLLQLHTLPPPLIGLQGSL